MTAAKPDTARMLTTLFQVALGGAIGASLRFLAGAGISRLANPSFPFAVIAVNIVGSFLMGLFVVYAGQRGLTHLQPFIMTGILGGFTTFSAFSLEAFTLFERGQTVAAAIYVLGSVTLSIAALVAGVALARAAL